MLNTPNSTEKIDSVAGSGTQRRLSLYYGKGFKDEGYI